MGGLCFSHTHTHHSPVGYVIRTIIFWRKPIPVTSSPGAVLKVFAFFIIFSDHNTVMWYNGTHGIHVFSLQTQNTINLAFFFFNFLTISVNVYFSVTDREVIWSRGALFWPSYLIYDSVVKKRPTGSRVASLAPSGEVILTCWLLEKIKFGSRGFRGPVDQHSDMFFRISTKIYIQMSTTGGRNSRCELYLTWTAAQISMPRGRRAEHILYQTSHTDCVVSSFGGG